MHGFCTASVFSTDRRSVGSYLTEHEFRNFFNYYKGLAHQQDGIDKLREMLEEGCPSALERDSAWVKAFRNERAAGGPPEGKILEVPYQSQRDNASGQGGRECFSSSCAMVAMYYGKVANDDEYNLRRSRHGDSTSVQAQIATLEEMGLEVEFVQDASIAMLRQNIIENRPTPVGWLHKGHVSKPSGGGHWSVAIGYTKEAVLHHDPYGEAYLIAGGYLPASCGKSRIYSLENWLPRWCVEGPATGWLLDIYP